MKEYTSAPLLHLTQSKAHTFKICQETEGPTQVLPELHSQSERANGCRGYHYN